MKAKNPNFEDRLFSIVRNFEEYGYYDRDEQKAIKLLHHYHPEQSPTVCEQKFQQLLKAYRDINSLFDKNPAVSPARLNGLFTWIYDWRYLH